MDFLWQTQGVQTEVFGARAGDTTTLKITTQAIIGQIPTICRDVSTKVIWYKSSVWRQSPEHPNIICHGLKENTASSKKKIAPQVSSESPFFNENIKKFWTFLIFYGEHGEVSFLTSRINYVTCLSFIIRSTKISISVIRDSSLFPPWSVPQILRYESFQKRNHLRPLHVFPFLKF